MHRSHLHGSRYLPLLFAVLWAAPAILEAKAVNRYQRHNLVSDSALRAVNEDTDLVNGWGLAASPTGPWWVNSADENLSLVYNGEGEKSALVVPVSGEPTGIVFDGGGRFTIPGSGSSLFIFAGEDGTLSAWTSDLSPTAQSVIVADNSGSGAVYTGLAIDSTTDGNRLYAANFAQSRVDVFDSSFHATTLAGDFVDPNLPAKYAPFGIQTLAGSVYVAYAQQNEDGDEEVQGEGKGIVSKFDLDGHFLARVATRKGLNTPWGLALAPAGFGKFSGKLLVGNLGSGEINAYDPVTFKSLGKLRTRGGEVLRIDGLWGIAFGNGAAAGPANALFFAAGPEDETHGLFGRIDALGGQSQTAAAEDEEEEE